MHHTKYCAAAHDSLKNPTEGETGTAMGVGRTALDYLIEVREIDFVSAVELLCGERGALVSRLQTGVRVHTQSKPFRLPEAN